MLLLLLLLLLLLTRHHGRVTMIGSMSIIAAPSFTDFIFNVI